MSFLAMCSITKQNREDCGYPGMSEQECSSRDCCWETTDYEIPWCYFPSKYLYTYPTLSDITGPNLFPNAIMKTTWRDILTHYLVCMSLSIMSYSDSVLSTDPWLGSVYCPVKHSCSHFEFGPSKPNGDLCISLVWNIDHEWAKPQFFFRWR